MTYVALLRGINVGGNNKIEMRRLKEAFERAGMESVATYINSGNVVFWDGSGAKQAALAASLEKAIVEEFSLEIPVLLVNIDSFRVIAEHVPESWQNDTVAKTDCLFLWPAADSEKSVAALAPKPGIDEARYVPGALLWRIARRDYGKSALPAIVGTPFYRQVTVRNINTVRKLWERMAATDKLYND